MRSRDPASIASTSKRGCQRASAATTRPTAFSTLASSSSPAITTVSAGASPASGDLGFAVDMERVLVERVVVAQRDEAAELAPAEAENPVRARVEEPRRAPVDVVGRQVERDRDARERPHAAQHLLDEAVPGLPRVVEA